MMQLYTIYMELQIGNALECGKVIAMAGMDVTSCCDRRGRRMNDAYRVPMYSSIDSCWSWLREIVQLTTLKKEGDLWHNHKANEESRTRRDLC